jgi:IPT/TIG domain
LKSSRSYGRLIAQAACALVALAALLTVFQTSVGAANSAFQFKELMAGANGNSRVQFIVIQQQLGQNLWGPQPGENESRDMLVFYDSAGRETGIFKFPKNPATGGTLQTLIATREFASLPGVPVPDVIIPPLLTPIAGKVCFRNNPANRSASFINECVSYGDFSGDTEMNRADARSVAVPAGPPAASLPILNAVSLHRATEKGRNSDFRLATATPTNIAGASINIPVASQIDQGFSLFINETFLGNGRTCATCHVVNDGFRLSPANIQARFATLASPTNSFDPLFIGEFKPSSFDAGFDFNLNTLVLTAAVATPSPCTGDLQGVITTANGGVGKVLARVNSTTYLVYGGMNPTMTGVVSDGVCSGTVAGITAGDLAVAPGSSVPGLEDPRMMRTSASTSLFPQGRGLILENIDLFSNPPVFRKSPHLLNLSRTGPFGLSGNVPDLGSFVTQAVIQHFPRTLARNSSGPNPDFRLPTPAEGAALEAFMRALEFPSVNDPNKFDLDRYATTSAQRLGRAQFFGTPTSPNCSTCHGGPVLAQTTLSIQGKPAGVNASFNTGTVNDTVFGDNIPCEPATTSVAPCNSREFSIPSLITVNNLGPFFHNASAATLQAAVSFYNSSAFFNSPANAALSAQGIFINTGTAITSFLAGLSARPYTLTAGPIRFGLQATNAGATAAQSISVTNTSSSAISFPSQACSLTGTDAGQFVITSCPLAPLLPAGQTATVMVTFDPSTIGLKSATLEINASVPSGIDLFGVGDILPAAPTLTSIAANSGTADGGDAVTLTGTNFTNGAVVTIGGVRAGFVKVVTGTSITARTGLHSPGSADVVVTNPDGQSATLPNGFNYTASLPLSLATIAPLSGSSLGAMITINGTGFHDGAAVSVGGVPSTNVTVITSTTMTATTGPHTSGIEDVCVTNPNGQRFCLANAYTYEFAPPPAISIVTPSSGSYQGGTAITVQGSGFAIGTAVTVGGVTADVTSVTPTRITAVTRLHPPGTLDVGITNPDGQTASQANAFTYLPPTITSISPSSGSTAGGTGVNIIGTGFAPDAIVTFGGSPATNLSIFGQSQISASTPPHAAGLVSVVVTNADGRTASGAFTYVLPVISSISPNSGPIAGGTRVDIFGSGFGSGATVTFGGSAGTNVSASETAIFVTAPAHVAGAVNVVVTNANGTSATKVGGFTYVLPAITSLSPTSGNTSGGTSVFISGGGFAQGASVTFDSIPGTNLSISDASISVSTPAHAAGSVNVVVTNPDGSAVTKVNGFTYVLPVITSVSPNSGTTVGGTNVNISGSGFAQGAGVSFGGVLATNVSGNESFISATTPPHAAGAVDVVVTNPNGPAATKVSGFTYVPPAITSISPTSGTTSGGTFVNISGAGFASGATVAFDGIQATSVSASETSISAKTPAHAAASVNVVVTNPNGSAATKVNGFAYILPAITSISPGSGTSNGGTSVFIAGAGFAVGAKVTFGGIIATNVSLSDTQIFATTPPHAAGSVDIVVTNPDGSTATKANAFVYVLPSITSISPSSGNTGGGTSVNISGSGFAQGATVTFGGVPATNVSASETSIFATTPAHAVGTVSIVVTNPNGATATSVNGFTYVPPTIISLSPSSGNTGGGTFVNISGSGFSQGATVTLGGIPATNVFANEGFISLTTPAHAAGAVSVVVTNPNGTTVTSANAFTYVLPTITSINPLTGNTGGGTSVNISGAGFAQGATITFGGVAATNVSGSDAFISATTPAHAAAVVSVTVTNPNGTAFTLLNGFTYVLPTITSLNPTSGSSNGGTFVNINGAGISQNATVTFGGVPATSVFPFGNEAGISAITPLHAAGSVDVVVTNPNGATATSTNGFLYMPAVTVSTAIPSSGSSLGGTAVSIAGTGFTTGATVKVGGVAATNVVVVSATSITAVTGPHPSGLADIVVTNPNGMAGTRANGFFYAAAPAPQVTAIAPQSGSSLGGTSVTISGTAFAQGATVFIGGATATNVSFVNSGVLTASSGPHAAGLVDVKVMNIDGQSGTLSNAFTYIAAAPPTLASIVPSSGPLPGGTAVTIIGTGFGNGATITIGGQPATNVTFVNSTTIVAATGSRQTAGAVDVVLTNPDSQSGTLANAFNYISTPTNDDFENRFTVVGAGSMTATGSNVGATSQAAEPSDLINAGSGTPSVWWTWRATCSFTVTSPNSFIDTIGSSFDTQLGVFTGSSLSSLLWFSSDDDSGGNLTSRVPNDTTGTLSIAAGTLFQIRVRGFSNSSTGTIVLHINSPCGITGVIPASGPSTGGTGVTVIGAGFADGAAVSFGGVNATAANVASSTMMTATTGAHAPGAVDVTVTNADQTTATLPNGFTFIGPPKRVGGQITSQ